MKHGVQVLREETIATVANEIWPLDNLSSDEARAELLRDIERGLEKAGLITQHQESA